MAIRLLTETLIAHVNTSSECALPFLTDSMAPHSAVVRRRDGAGGVRAGLGDLGRLGRGDGRSGGGLDGGHRGEGCAARATQGVQRGSVTGGACS